MRRAAAGVGAFALLVAATGCGDGGGEGGDVPFNRLAAGFAAALCHKDFVCCDAAELNNPADPAASEATCRRELANAWAAGLVEQAALINMGSLVYRGDHARLCLDEIAAQPCAEWGASTDLNQYPDCRQIYDGTIPLGDACSGGGQCAGGFCSAGTCTVRGQIGAPCTSADACQPELTCVRDAATASSVCVAPLPNGSACSVGSDCDSTSCVANLCSPRTTCDGV